MPAPTVLFTRRRLVIAVVVLLVAAAAVAAVVSLTTGADPAAGSTSAPAATAPAAATDDEPAASERAESDQDEGGPRASDESGEEPAEEEAREPAARETLEPRPFDATATPEPGVSLTVASVEKVTGEANVPGEVGGPALRFTVQMVNDTGKELDLRTVVVNAYYGPDRTPAAPLLKPGGKAFEAEAGVDDVARGVFVFNVPAEFQDVVELEVDPGIGKPVVIFAGA